MSLGHAVFILAFFWAGIHLMHRIFNWSSSTSLLPTTSIRSSRQGLRNWDVSNTQISLNKLHLRLQTDVFNALHGRITSKLIRRKGPVSIGLKLFYNLGVYLGVAGLLTSIALLLWTSSQLMFPVLHTAFAGLGENGALVPPSLARRGMDLDGGYDNKGGFGLMPIVRLSHLICSDY